MPISNTFTIVDNISCNRQIVYAWVLVHTIYTTKFSLTRFSLTSFIVFARVYVTWIENPCSKAGHACQPFWQGYVLVCMVIKENWTACRLSSDCMCHWHMGPLQGLLVGPWQDATKEYNLGSNYSPYRCAVDIIWKILATLTPKRTSLPHLQMQGACKDGTLTLWNGKTPKWVPVQACWTGNYAVR